jgi:phage major head subunit gpT-like protein
MSVQINPAANRIFQEFDTEFMKQLNESPRVWPAFGMEVPSSSRSSLHAWLIDEAQVREWNGSRVLNEMGSIVWEVINRDWELSWRFKEQQIRDDLSGLVALAIQRARGYAEKWARHEDTLVATAVQQGKNKACYDGSNFFSASHPNDPLGLVSGTFDNLFTSRPLNIANLIFGLQKMRSLKLPDGSPWIGPQSRIKLMFDASLEFTAKQMLQMIYLTPAPAFGLSSTAGVSQNVVQGSVDPVLNPYLNSEAGTWYLCAEDSGIRPIMFQRRQAVESQELGPGSQLFFDRKEYQIGQDARYEASYTHPQLMFRFEPA